MSLVKRFVMLLSIFMITIVSNNSNMNLIEKIDYELKRHLYIDDIYYRFRTDIYTILNIDYKVSNEILDNELTIYKVGNRLVIESDSELVLNYQDGHIYIM